MLSPSLKLNVGSEVILWNKVMKEVGKKRFAGPFSEIPFKNFIQSPIGLVPKDNGKDVCFIFHLSYPRQPKGSVPLSLNANTPAEDCSVQYCDFDMAVRLCMAEGKSCKMAKSDMSLAFRNLGIRKTHWKYLILKAVNPKDGKTYYFIDKCLPFGAAISCSHFQRFSNAVLHIVEFKSKKPNVNYLDDYLFIALLAWMCDLQIRTFLSVCEQINFPFSLEKTF